MEPTFWKKSGWMAKVIKNEDDDGWAVEMTRIGDAEPALVGPWTMGRDKKNPKPLNPKDFSTLVKTANEVLERAVAHARAKLHKSIYTTAADGTRLRVHLDIVADEDDPSATVTAFDDATNMVLWKKDVPPNFTLTPKAVAGLRSSSRSDD
ncbi:MAG TPA: hypothetical protein VGF99_10635 [Myxococcota bacterium]